MMIQTVEEIKRNFTKRELEKAEEARRLYVIVGRPGRKIFEDILRKGCLINNDLTVQDYRNALQVCGEDLGVLKDKTARRKPEHITVDTTTERASKQDIILSITGSQEEYYYEGITTSVSTVPRARTYGRCSGFHRE